VLLLREVEEGLAELDGPIAGQDNLVTREGDNVVSIFDLCRMGCGQGLGRVTATT